MSLQQPKVHFLFQHWSIAYLYRNIWKPYWTKMWILISHHSSKYYMQYTEYHFFCVWNGGSVLLPKMQSFKDFVWEKELFVCTFVYVCWHIASVAKSTSYSKCGNFTEHVRAPPQITSSNTQSEGFLESIPRTARCSSLCYKIYSYA